MVHCDVLRHASCVTCWLACRSATSTATCSCGMHLGDFPFELQLQVLRLCSHRVWASLSRVHSSLRDAADYSLYSHIRIEHCYSCSYSRYCHSIDHHCRSFHQIFGTLATNAQKASLVRVFELVAEVYTQELEIIARMLPNMLNLYKLRILLKRWESVMSGGINKAIRFVFIQAMIIGKYDY